MDISKEMKDTYNAEEAEAIETTEGAIPVPTNNEIAIDPKKIENIVAHNNLILQCEQCSNDLKNPELQDYINEAIRIMEIKFTDICHETKISEKLAKIVEAECFLPCSIQCTHLRVVLISTLVQEFIKTWCLFINRILQRKIEIQSCNFIYNTAQRMSTKYIKK